MFQLGSTFISQDWIQNFAGNNAVPVKLFLIYPANEVAPLIHLVKTGFIRQFVQLWIQLFNFIRKRNLIFAANEFFLKCQAIIVKTLDF